MALLDISILERKPGRITVSVPHNEDTNSYQVYTSITTETTPEYTARKLVPAAKEKGNFFSRQYTPTKDGDRDIIIVSDSEAVSVPWEDFFMRVTAIDSGGSESAIADSPGKTIAKIDNYPTP